MLKEKLLKHAHRCLIAILTILVLGISDVNAQVVVDEVIGVIGKHIILKSDLENSYQQYRAQQGIKGTESEVKCQILEGLMFSKLLLHHGEVDSVEVSDSQVEGSLDMRMNYFMRQFGTETAMEQYYNKSIDVIKDDLRTLIKEQMIADAKQSEITSTISMTPTEVKDYFDGMPKDSIPMINSTYEIAQLVKAPVISQSVKDEVRSRMESFRNRILAGESFETLAILYSEDPGSASKGGETGLTKRGNWDKNFEMAAFSLKPGEVSEIIESVFGYHILKYVERRGDFMNVKHILLMVKPSFDDITKAHGFLDSISQLIKVDSITFDEAVRLHSDDPSKINGGFIINPQSGNSQFREESLDPAIAYTVKQMTVGETSAPVSFKTKDNKDSYRILNLVSKSLPHKADIAVDYDQIQIWALSRRRQETLDAWAKEKIKKTYIRLHDEYKSCKFVNTWY